MIHLLARVARSEAALRHQPWRNERSYWAIDVAERFRWRPGWRPPATLPSPLNAEANCHPEMGDRLCGPASGQAARRQRWRKGQRKVGKAPTIAKIFGRSRRPAGPFPSNRAKRHQRPAAAAVELPAVLCLELGRSEEHTSELQSPCNLVCRLLLEK